MMSLKKATLFFLFLLFQGVFLSGLNSQQIIINEDPAIRQMMDNYARWNLEEDKVQGWRIQIINTDDRRKMEKALNEFRMRFHDVDYSRWKQVSPYYKVIIGAYESKMDALAFLQEVKEYFPSAIPVIEKISKKELLGLR